MELIFMFLGSVLISLGIKAESCANEPDGGYFYYFAYGSNMLPERMHINCKTAISTSTAKLENYRLDFNMLSSLWNGAVATIVKDDEATVWGNLWQISIFESCKLDEWQESGNQNYDSMEVNVTLTCGTNVTARVYVIRHPPHEKLPPEELRRKRQPSRTYLNVIMLGALRCHLPVSYLNYLLRFPNNGRLATSKIRKDLGYPFYDSSFTESEPESDIVSVVKGKNMSPKLGASLRMMQTVPNTFLYFAYGSNLLKKRIHINNPSAEFLGIGKLDGHQIDFIKFTTNWGGCSATIVPTEGAYVWGAVWRVHNDNMPALDKQEGVDSNWYFAKTVKVILPEGAIVECRTYQQTINPPARKDGEDIALDRQPSKTYMEVIIKGAIECQLPEDYIQKLKKITHNGKEASTEMMKKLKKN